jgi:hypothetical protein
MSTNFPVNRRTSSNVLGTPPDARLHVDALGKNGVPSLRAPRTGSAAPTSAQEQAAMRPMGEAYQGPSAMETRLAQVSDGQPVYADRPHYADTVADGAVASELRLEQAGLKLGGGEVNLLSGHGGKSAYVQTGSGELYRLKLRDQGGIDVTGMVTGKRGQDAPLTPADWQQAKRWLNTQTQTQEQTQPQTPEQRRASAAAPLLVRRVEEALRAGGMDGMSYPQGSFTMSVPRSVVRPASDPIDPLHQARDQLGLGYVSGKSDQLRIPNDAFGGAFIRRAEQSGACDEIGNTLGGSKGTQLDGVAKLFASKGASAEFMKGLRATQGQGRIAGVFGIAEGVMGMFAMGKGVRVLKARAQGRYPVQQLPFSRDRSVEKIVKEHLHNAASAARAVAKQTPNTAPTALPVTPPTTSTPTPPPIRGRARHQGKLYQPGVTKAARAVAGGKAGSHSRADPRVTGNGVNGTHTQQPMQPAAPHVQHADQAQHTQHAQQHQRSEGTKRLSARLKAMLIDCESPRTINMGAGRERKSFVVGVNARNGQRFQIEINPNGSLNRHSVSLSAGTHFASNEPNEGNRESDIARTQLQRGEDASNQKLLPGGHEAIRLPDGHKVFVYQWGEHSSWPSTVQDAAAKAGFTENDGPLVFVPKVRDPSGRRPQNESTPELRTWASVVGTKLFDPQMMAMINESPTLLKLLQLALSENLVVTTEGSGIAHYRADEHLINLGQDANSSPAELLDLMAHELSHATDDSIGKESIESVEKYLQDCYKQEASAMLNQIKVYLELRKAYDQKVRSGDTSAVPPAQPHHEISPGTASIVARGILDKLGDLLFYSPDNAEKFARSIRYRYEKNGNEERALKDLTRFAADPGNGWTKDYSTYYLTTHFKTGPRSINSLIDALKAQPAHSVYLAKEWIRQANNYQLDEFIELLKQAPELKNSLESKGITFDLDNRFGVLLKRNLTETNNHDAQEKLFMDCAKKVTTNLGKERLLKVAEESGIWTAQEMLQVRQWIQDSGHHF